MTGEAEAISDLRRSRRKAWAAAVVAFLMFGAIGFLAVRAPEATIMSSGKRASGTFQGAVSVQENRFAGIFCLLLAHGALVAAWVYHGRVERLIALEGSDAMKGSEPHS